MTRDEAIKILSQFVSKGYSIESLPEADGVLAFGNGPFGKRICQHVAALYQAGKARRIIVSGNRIDAFPPPEGYSTEADYFKEQLLEYGVPADLIILEDQATNTYENAIYGIEAARDVGFTPQSLILVAAPMSNHRAWATFVKNHPGITAYSSTYEMSFEEWSKPERVIRLLGEIDRFPRYAEKGDILMIELPTEVKEAYKVIKQTIKE